MRSPLSLSLWQESGRKREGARAFVDSGLRVSLSSLATLSSLTVRTVAYALSSMRRLYHLHTQCTIASNWFVLTQINPLHIELEEISIKFRLTQFVVHKNLAPIDLPLVRLRGREGKRERHPLLLRCGV